MNSPSPASVVSYIGELSAEPPVDKQFAQKHASEAEAGRQNWLTYRACLGKYAYETAPLAAAAASQQRALNGADLHIYECDFCESFHLTSRGVGPSAYVDEPIPVIIGRIPDCFDRGRTKNKPQRRPRGHVVHLATDEEAAEFFTKYRTNSGRVAA